MALTSTTVSAAMSGGETNAFGAVTVTASVAHTTASNTLALAAGSGSGQAQVITEFIGSGITTSGTTYDLTAIAGGFNGANRNYTAIKGVIIECTDATNNATIDAGASNGWTGINGTTSSAPQTIEVGGWWAKYNPVNGIATIDGTHKTILVKAAASTTSIKISLVGTGS